MDTEITTQVWWCFWFCSAPNFSSGGPTPSCWGFPLVFQHPLFTGLIFHYLNRSQTNGSHWYTTERWKHVDKQCFPRRRKKLKFHLSWVVKPVGSVQTSHKSLPDWTGRGSSPRQTGVFLLPCESTLSQKSLCTQKGSEDEIIPACIQALKIFLKMPNAQLFWPPSQGFPDLSLIIYIFLNTGPPLSSRPVLTRLEWIEEIIVHVHLADKQFSSNRGLN